MDLNDAAFVERCESLHPEFGDLSAEQFSLALLEDDGGLVWVAAAAAAAPVFSAAPAPEPGAGVGAAAIAIMTLRRRR